MQTPLHESAVRHQTWHSSPMTKQHEWGNSAAKFIREQGRHSWAEVRPPPARRPEGKIQMIQNDTTPPELQELKKGKWRALGARCPSCMATGPGTRILYELSCNIISTEEDLKTVHAYFIPRCASDPSSPLPFSTPPV